VIVPDQKVTVGAL